MLESGAPYGDIIPQNPGEVVNERKKECEYLENKL